MQSDDTELPDEVKSIAEGSVAKADKMQSDDTELPDEVKSIAEGSVAKAVEKISEEISDVKGQTLQKYQPTREDLELFFASYEESEAQNLKNFIEKYNFDPINDVPVPGRFKWEEVNVDAEKEEVPVDAEEGTAEKLCAEDNVKAEEADATEKVEIINSDEKAEEKTIAENKM